MKVRVENERKWLVSRVNLKCLENGVEMTQGYLCVDPPIRVRVENFEDSFLTIKIKEAPGINLEFEVEIPKQFAEKFMRSCKHYRIRKTRYKIGRLEVDVFYGELAGLVLAEFEQSFPGEKIEIPKSLVVKEVTDDEQFLNHNLCQLNELPKEWMCEFVPKKL